MAYAAGRAYGWLDTRNILASAPMRIPYASLEGDNLKNLALPSGVLYRDFLRGTKNSTLVADLPDGEYRVTAIVANQPEIANGAFEIRAAGKGMRDSPPISYTLAETGDKFMDVRAAGGQLAIEFVPSQSREWLVSGLIFTRRAPHIGHIPVASAVPGLRVTIAATITAPDGIERAELQLEVDGERKPIVVQLMPDGSRFSADLEWNQRWEGRAAGYFITAIDKRGRPSRLPAAGKMAVYIGREPAPPVIRHDPVTSCEPGQPLRLAFVIAGASPISSARLYYRHLTQMESYRTADLTASGDKYEATIPGDFVTTDHDIMYYVEALDRLGGGTFYPDPDRTAPYVIVKVKHPQ
jgi:hypothetical protein